MELSQHINCGVVVVAEELIVYRRKSHKNQLVLCTTVTIPNFSHTIRGCEQKNNVIESRELLHAVRVLWYCESVRVANFLYLTQYKH